MLQASFVERSYRDMECHAWLQASFVEPLRSAVHTHGEAIQHAVGNVGRGELFNARRRMYDRIAGSEKLAKGMRRPADDTRIRHVRWHVEEGVSRFAFLHRLSGCKRKSPLICCLFHLQVFVLDLLLTLRGACCSFMSCSDSMLLLSLAPLCSANR